MTPFIPWEIFPSEPAAAILPWAPDWADGVQESLSWKMGSAMSKSGVEQRRSVRRDPRQRIEFTSLIEPDDVPLLQALLLGWSNQTWAVPLWYGQVSLSFAATAGDTVLDVSGGTDTLLQVGGWALVWDDSRTMEYAQVLSFSDTTVELDAPLMGNFPIGTKVLPLQFMTLQDSQSFAPLTSAVTKVAWVFEQVPGHGQALEVAPATVWSETFPTGADNTEPRNHYFTFPHNWSGSPEITVSTLADVHDPGAGVLSRRLAVDRTSPMWGVDTLLDTREATAALRRFLSAHRGPTVSFWAPSPMRDMGLAGDIPGPALPVVNNAQHLVPAALRLGVEITYPGGEVRSRVTGITPTTVTLATDPGPIALADVGRARWVTRARLAVETVTIRHITERVATVRLPVVAVDIGDAIDARPTVSAPSAGGGLGGGGDGSTVVAFSATSYAWTDVSDVPPRATVVLSSALTEDVTVRVTATTSGGLNPSVTATFDVLIPAGETILQFAIPGGLTEGVNLRTGMAASVGSVYTLALYEVSPLLRLGAPIAATITNVGILP